MTTETIMTTNLVRMLSDSEAVELRSAGEDETVPEGQTGETLTGHFARFGEWAEIRSVFEGHFLERFEPGAFAGVFGDQAARSRIKVLYDHGRDPSMGNKPLGVPEVLEEDSRGARYEVPLLDTDYNRGFIIPAARAGVLGASFRFSVPEGGDEMTRPARATKHNPDRLKERRVHAAIVHEMGPVTFPAYAGASAGLRSGTDDWFHALRSNPKFLAELLERVGPNIHAQILDSLDAAADGPDGEENRTADGLGTLTTDLALALTEQRRLRRT